MLLHWVVSRHAHLENTNFGPNIVYLFVYVKNEHEVGWRFREILEDLEEKVEG